MNFPLSRPETGTEFNRRLVLNQIRQRTGISRSDVMRLTSLRKATVLAIVTELIEIGLVMENGDQNPPTGGPRISLTLASDANFVLGAELTGEECCIALMNLQAEPTRRGCAARPAHAAGTDPGECRSLF